MTKHGLLEINLSDLGGPVFIGRPKGENARLKYKLDEVDKSDQKVIIKIPSDVYSINSSFFLGFFGKSVRNAGSPEVFKGKYRFEGPSDVIMEIEKYIAKALHRYDPLIE